MFTFDILEYDDILQGLNAARIDVKEANLKFPKPVTITQIYRKYLMVLASFDDESQLEHPHLATNIEAPQELRSGFVFLNFWRNMVLLAKSAAIDQFSLTDLFKPDKSRVQYILSGLINIAFFREDRLAMFQQLQEELNQKIRENEEMEMQVQAYENRIRAKQNERMDQRNEIEAMENTKRQLLMKISETEEARTGLDDYLTKLKSEEAAVRAKLDAQKKESARILEELNTLKIQLDLSPDEIKGDLEQAQKRYSAELELEAQKRRELQARKRHDAALQNTIDDLIQVLDMVQPIEKEMRKLGEVYQDEEQLEREKAELEKKRQEVEALRKQKETKTGEAEKKAQEGKKLDSMIQKQRRVLKDLQYQQDRALGDYADRMSSLRREIQDYLDKLKDSMDRVGHKSS